MGWLPDITYPLSVDTIGKMLALGQQVQVHCHAYGCGHSGRLNLVQLARKVGLDYPCMEGDLKKHVYCPRCREAGREQSIGFICTPLDAPHSEWPLEREIWRQNVGRRAGTV